MFNNNSQHIPKSTGAKFMYINQELVNNMQQKVLINPNFSRVKPHINMQFLSNQTIHINPNKFKRVQPSQVTSQLNNVPFLRVSQNSMASKVNTPVIPSKTKLVKFNRTKVVNAKSDQTNFNNTNQINVCDASNIVVNTRTKLLRVNGSDKLNALCLKQKGPDPTMLQKPQAVGTYNKNKIIVSTRTKLIRSNKINTQVKSTTMKSRFKIIRNTSAKKNTQILQHNRFKLDKRSRRLSKSTNIHLIHTATALNRKLKSSKLMTKGKEKLLRIRGQKYKLDSNQRTLTLISENCENVNPNFKTINLGGITFKQKQPNVFVKVNLNRTLDQKHVNISRSKMKKSNISCSLYRRFGKCKGKEKGTCIRVHNPDQIALCPRFLQGACIDDKCLLSHKVSLEKMPTCKFFLEGLCTRENCSYLHVKISAKADICKDFLEGFCKKGAECDKRHVMLCPAFEKTNKCLQKNCPYPHATVVRKSNLSKHKNALKLHYLNDITKNHPVINKNDDLSDKNAIVNNETNLDNMTGRYYKESNDNYVLVSNVETVKFNDEQIDMHLKRKRPNVGDLPSYIPFLDEEQI